MPGEHQRADGDGRSGRTVFSIADPPGSPPGSENGLPEPAFPPASPFASSASEASSEATDSRDAEPGAATIASLPGVLERLADRIGASGEDALRVTPDAGRLEAALAGFLRGYLDGAGASGPVDGGAERV